MEALGRVEALVAVAALNQARAAPGVVDAVAAGLARGFTGRKAAVLFVDGGSQDGTLDAVDHRPSSGHARPRREPPPHRPPRPGPRRGGGPGGRAPRGRARGRRRRRRAGQHRAGVGRGARSSLRSRARPTTSAPVYVRAPTEGTLTTNLLAPLVRSLFGQRLQEALGSCAGVSAALLEALPAADEWSDEPTGPGAEMRLLGLALAGRHAIVEVAAGSKAARPRRRARRSRAHGGRRGGAALPAHGAPRRGVAGGPRERARLAARRARPRDAAGR